MTQVIKARRGERIVLDEYPKGFAEDLNARLNGVAGEDDASLTAVDRLAERILDLSLEQGVKVLGVAVLALTVWVVAAQIVMAVS